MIGIENNSTFIKNCIEVVILYNEINVTLINFNN
jgi:hypothetical protein